MADVITVNGVQYEVRQMSGQYLVRTNPQKLIGSVQSESVAVEALDEVNKEREGKRLKPFQYDSALTIAAQTIALERAKALNPNHTKNDFSGLPDGTHADAAGCAAWPQGEGWGSCCMFENWEYGGAAYAIGSDGLRYMSLFVSHKPNRPLMKEHSYE